MTVPPREKAWSFADDPGQTTEIKRAYIPPSERHNSPEMIASLAAAGIDPRPKKGPNRRTVLQWGTVALGGIIGGGIVTDLLLRPKHTVDTSGGDKTQATTGPVPGFDHDPYKDSPDRINPADLAKITDSTELLAAFSISAKDVSTPEEFARAFARTLDGMDMAGCTVEEITEYESTRGTNLDQFGKVTGEKYNRTAQTAILGPTKWSEGFAQKHDITGLRYAYGYEHGNRTPYNVETTFGEIISTDGELGDYSSMSLTIFRKDNAVAAGIPLEQPVDTVTRYDLRGIKVVEGRYIISDFGSETTNN